MSAVSEWIVREYVEAQGFLVQQPRKYVVQSRRKRPEEEVDLLVMNPRAIAHVVPDHVVWTSTDLKDISRAIVGVRGWHTESFSPAKFDMAPEIFRFADKGAEGRVAQILGPGPVAKILCLPGLSGAAAMKSKSLEILRAKGIDGVIAFPTMLIELVNLIEVTNNYEKSDLLQVLRILKNYDLIKEPQMELFRRSKSGNQ